MGQVAGSQQRGIIGWHGPVKSRDLMRASERWLVDRHVPKVNLMVRTTNVAVLAFYESLGYEDGGVVVLGKFRER